VNRLRTLSTRSLIALAAVALVAVVGAAIAVAARNAGPTPAPKALPDAIHDALTAQEPAGVTARIAFTNKLFPSGSLIGSAGSALMSGATGRLWVSNDGRGRLELQSDAAGDVQIVWNDTQATVYDASSNTVYRFAFPAKTGTDKQDNGTPPAVADIQKFLTELGAQATVSDARPTNVAGQPAYSVSVSPKHDGGLLGSAELAWDAVHGVPLRIGVYAHGASTPVLELKATDISFGAIASSDLDVSPPAGAKVVDVTAPTQGGNGGGGKDQPAVTGLDAVKAAAGFPVAAPDTLVGLPRKDVRLVGEGDSKGALVVYGQGLGAIVLVEHAAGASAKPGMLQSLPTVSLDGVTAHELATQLGTAIEWRKGGVDYVLAGSLPAAAAEAAARTLG
jgi:outer membrane lipoprotein-sorting protein